jgi:putative phosphoribosyl transferase
MTGADHNGGAMRARELEIAASATDAICGDLVAPDGASGIVVFAHGSGSSRHSRRNRQVAGGLQARGLATLLLDLLTPVEAAVDERTAEFRFDIDLLAGRLLLAAAVLERDPSTADLPIGLFGASTGAAATLVAAAQRPSAVHAVVSRGGRPDLAGPALARVTAPTLLIVGGRDDVVLGLNRQAATQLGGPHDLVVVPDATHLFPEPGALDVVERLAADWFSAHLSPATAPEARR